MVDQKLEFSLVPTPNWPIMFLHFMNLFLPLMPVCFGWICFAVFERICVFLTYLWFCFDQQSFSNLFFFPTYLQHRRVIDTGPIVDTTTILDDSYVSVSTYSIYSIHNIYSIYVQYLQYLRTISTYHGSSIYVSTEWYLQHRRVMDTGPILDTIAILGDSYGTNIPS